MSASVSKKVLHLAQRCYKSYDAALYTVTHGKSFLHLFQEIQATELRKSKIYIQVYVVWMKFFLIEVIPYILIIVLNSIMIAR